MSKVFANVLVHRIIDVIECTKVYSQQKLEVVYIYT